MITIELLKECRLEFKEYFKSLTFNSPENQHKADEVRTHSLRVVDNALMLAKFVLQTEEDKYIAELVALFHDIGKATLIIQGNDSPTNIIRDHAAFSAKLIQEMKFYAELPVDVQIILIRSVENHSKLKLPKLENEQVTLFARLLRDADKLDILDSAYHYFKEKYGVRPLMSYDLINNSEISDKIIKTVLSGKTASIEDMKTMNDYKLLLMSMSFDINFKYTFRIMSERQYVQKIYETLPKRDLIIDVYRSIKLFVENKFVS
jgi:putative nucleotidyltransferase with HDIG domain